MQDPAVPEELEKALDMLNLGKNNNPNSKTTVDIIKFFRETQSAISNRQLCGTYAELNKGRPYVTKPFMSMWIECGLWLKRKACEVKYPRELKFYCFKIDQACVLHFDAEKDDDPRLDPFDWLDLMGGPVSLLFDIAELKRVAKLPADTKGLLQQITGFTNSWGTAKNIMKTPCQVAMKYHIKHYVTEVFWSKIHAGEHISKESLRDLINQCTAEMDRLRVSEELAGPREPPIAFAGVTVQPPVTSVSQWVEFTAHGLVKDLARGGPLVVTQVERLVHAPLATRPTTS